MADFAVRDVQLPADFEQQIASQLASLGPNFAVQPPAQSAPPEAPAQAAPQFDVNAYLAANPDLAANWQSGGVMRDLGADLASAAAQHYGRTGQFEVAAGQRGGAPAYDVNFSVPMSGKTGTVTERGMGPNPDFGVAPSGVTYNPAAHDDPTTPTVTATPAAAFDYSALRGGEPQLQPASGQYATPYYAAYTNDGDLAGAVMVAPGQKIRIVDPTNGNPIFEGEGPEGAKQAVAIANSISQEKGRKAAWQIQAENEQGGYTTQAAERYDPKKPGIFGALASVALPFVLTALFPPLGAIASSLGATGMAATMGNMAALNAIAGTGMGLASGQSLGNALKGGLQQGAFAGATAGLLDKLPVPVKNVLSTPQSWVNKGVQSVLDRVPILDQGVGAINSALKGGLGAVGGVTRPVFGAANTALNTINQYNPLTIAQNAVRGAFTAPTSVVPNLAGGLSGVTVPGASPAATGVGALGTAASSILNQTRSAPSGAAASEPPKTDGKDLSQVDVLLDDYGIPFSVFPGGFPGYTDLSGVDVEGQKTDKTTTSTPTPPSGGGTDLSGVDVTGQRPTTTTTTPGTPTPPPSTEPPKPPDTPKPQHPTIPLIPVGETPPPDNYYPISGAPGTRGSLSSIFSAKLPAPWERYAARKPNDMSGTDWKRYGMGPERSFFSVVPQSTPVRDLSGSSAATGGASSGAAAVGYPTFSSVQARLAQDSGRPPAPEGKRYIQRDDGVILLVDDSPEATYVGRSGATKKVRDLSVYQGGFTTKPISDFAAANLPEVIANLRKVGGLPMKRGGFAVHGDGDGREDAIPARLSDGEYVIDAETVALLGNGSSKAGAAKLDQFRVNVRKHKGRELAKGKFSANARDPHAYLSGGRS